MYCSYCERRIPTGLAVEHIQPKGLPQYAGLIGKWENFLLGCVNCNSTKHEKDVALEKTFLPDRDNTFYAFIYTPDGKVIPNPTLPADAIKIAQDTLALTGLDRPLNEVRDANGQLVAIDRVKQRMDTWAEATDSLADLQACPTDSMRRRIAHLARASGFFSIWMTVFEADAAMRQLFIDTFDGTAKDCFGTHAEPISPRPPNGLAHCGKI